MKFNWLLILGLLLGSSLAGCSTNKEDVSQSHQQEDEPHTEQVNGDIREETASWEELPTFLTKKDEKVQNLYTAVSQHKDVLENIPCYCGCGESVGHRSNYDCFIHENKENGSIVWDDHGTKCGVCLEIAAQSIIDYQEGKSIKKIRDEIDQAYEEGYADPTPTPEI